MDDLSKSSCEVCRTGAPKVSDQEIINFLQSLPEWKIAEESNILKLKRVFELKDFKETIKFVNLIAELAEDEGHHPVLLLEFDTVTVWWWTHKIEGLHKNDFIMAAKTDELNKSITGD
jgi:4a-hydroxytetrahydrobiopterin dehydratase